MIVYDTIPWSKFSTTIEEIRTSYGSHMYHNTEIYKENTVLFRGQASSQWNLLTTLERTTTKEYSVQEYVNIVSRHTNEIEAITGKKWNVPKGKELNKCLGNDKRHFWLSLPGYDCLVYLRHHGFPSPLLDWTTSPYIAAFFAFEQNCEAEECAVFAFIETPEGMKEYKGGDPVISTHGPYVTTDPRHFAQKAWYTTATRSDANMSNHRFCPYHEIVTPTTSTPKSAVLQDVLIKIPICRMDRVEALKQLDEYNINRYTLFQTEDALIQTMGLRAFDLAGR